MDPSTSEAAAGTPPTDDPVRRIVTEAVRAYDMSVEERLVRRPMPTLDIVNERFLRNLGRGIFQIARRSAEIVALPVGVQRFSEFLAALPPPVSYNIVSMKPLRGNGLVVCEATLISALVDVLYGGDGSMQSLIENRDFSPTEQRVIERLLGVVYAEYNKAWKELYPLELAHHRSETHAQFVNVATPNELVVVTTLRITIGAFEGAIHICKPYGALEPIRDVLYGPQQAEAMAEDRRWVSLLTREIQAAEVVLAAELAQPELTVEQLLAMKAGDFIPFDRPQRVVAAVDGTPVFTCRYGTHNAHYALRVEECLAGVDPHWLGASHVH